MPCSKMSPAVLRMSSSDIFLLMTRRRRSVPASGAMDTLRCPFIRATISALRLLARSEVMENSTPSVPSTSRAWG